MYFREDFQKNQKLYTQPPSSGGMTAAGFRERLVTWMKRAHGERKPELITDRFKKCAFYNACNGSENYRIAVRGAKNYDLKDEKMESQELIDMVKEQKD